MDNLFEEERKARIEGNLEKLEKIQNDIIEACGNEDDIIHVLKLLNNKRKQDSGCMRKLIRKIYDRRYSPNFYKNLLDSVIEGKTYLEEERMLIADYIKVSYGNNIKEAFAVMKEVPVETFTSISERKRNEFLFEQFRLALLLGLYVEAELIMRKAKQGYMTDEEKTIFLNYSILLRLGKKSFMEASKLYLELNKVDKSKTNITLGSFFCLMSNCITENANIREEKNSLLLEYEQNEMNDTDMRKVVNSFRQDLIIGFEYSETIFNILKEYSDKFAMVSEGNDLISAYSGELRKAILEHNFFVIKKFCSNLKIDQLCTILKVNEEETIDFISNMVNEKFTNVKINQQEGLIDFGSKKWNDDVSEVLDKLVLATNLIHQENIRMDINK